MDRYGQGITWGTLTAPHLCTGHCTAYSYRDVTSRQMETDEGGDHVAVALHSRKAQLSFAAAVTSGSADFLDLSQGAALSVSGISSGVVLARRAVERWRLNQRKTVSIEATHYPDMVQASPAAAGTDLDAFTPDQTVLDNTIVYPGGEIIWSTAGLTHASGVVHSLEIGQELQITEDDPSPVGTILGAASHGYMRTIRLELLSTGAKPEVRSVLVIGGAPGHGSDYRIEESDDVFEDRRGKMYSVTAIWIPPFTAS